MTTSHINIAPPPGDARASYEASLNRESTLRHGVDGGGPDCSAPKLPASSDYCDRLAKEARERGRPLTQTEIALVADGKPLPPVVRKEPAKTVEEQLVERLLKVEKCVDILIRRMDAADAAKSKKAPHLQNVETRSA
jgi:hypothetical protein